MDVVFDIIGYLIGGVGVIYGIKAHSTLKKFINVKEKYLSKVEELYSNSKARIYTFTTAWNVSQELETAILESEASEITFCGPINDIPSVSRVFWRMKLSERRVGLGLCPIVFYHSPMGTIGMKYVIGDKDVLISDSKDTTEGSSKGMHVKNAEGPMLEFLLRYFRRVIRDARTEPATMVIDRIIFRRIRDQFPDQDNNARSDINIGSVVSDLLNSSATEVQQLLGEGPLKEFLEKYIKEMIGRGKLRKSPNDDRCIQRIDRGARVLLEESEFCSNCLLLKTFEEKYPDWESRLQNAPLSFASANLKSVLYNLAKNYPKAIRSAEEAIRLNHYHSTSMAMVYNNLAHAKKELFVSKQLDEAQVLAEGKEIEEIFQTALKFDPNLFTAQKNLGILYFRMAQKSVSLQSQYWEKAEEMLNTYMDNTAGKFEGPYSLARYYGIRGMKRECEEQLQLVMNIQTHSYKEWLTGKEFVEEKYKEDQDHYFASVLDSTDKLIQSPSPAPLFGPAL